MPNRPVDEFTARRRLHAQRSAATGAVPVVASYLQKTGFSSRLYRIDPVAQQGWRCEVWFGATVHRTVLVSSRTLMLEQKRQFEREVAELLLDGWTDQQVAQP